MVTTPDRVMDEYETELAVRLRLVTRTGTLIYTRVKAALRFTGIYAA